MREDRKKGDLMRYLAKRGADKIQTGGPASTLIGIMTLIFVLYILFLPPDERRELLERNETSDGRNTALGTLLLDETPGRLEYTDKGVFDHPLPNSYLTEERNAAVLAQENPFAVSGSWFSHDTKRILFSIPDLSVTENVILSFQANERSGMLVITLNGKVIYENDVQVQNPAPVTLPKTLLAGTNELEFSVSGGALGNRYLISDVKVIGEVVAQGRQSASSSFTMSDTEYDNLDKSFIDFYPICDQREADVLTIEVNGRAVYSAVPACDSLNREDLDKRDLQSGKNTVVFKIKHGSYRVEQSRVRNVLKPVKSFIEYFDVDSDLYEDIQDKRVNITLRLEFVDDKKVKEARLNINGKYDEVDQRDDVYERDITSWAREGNNYLEIQPRTELNVPRVTVRVE